MKKPYSINADFASSMLHYLQARMKDRDFDAVIEHYEHNRAELDSATNEVAAETLRLVASAQACQADLKSALVTIRIAQAKAANITNRLVLAEVYITLAGLLRDMGQLGEATKAYRDAESIFRRYDAPDGACRAINQLAGLFFKQNNYQGSLELLLEAAELARKLEDKRGLAQIMGNIGRVATFLGNFSQAEKHLRLNIELSSERANAGDCAKAWLSLGYVQLQKGEYAEAETSLAEANSLISSIGDKRSEVIHLTYLGELQYRSGRVAEAISSLERALVLAEAFGSGTTLAARVMRHLAEAQVRVRNFRLASRLLAGATVIYKKANDLAELGALTKLRAQIEAARSNRSRARKLFAASISELESSGVKFELVQALLEAAACEQFDSRERMGFVFRAEQISNRLGLRGQLETIERIITSFDGAPKASPNSRSRTESEQADYVTNSPELIHMKDQVAVLANSDLPLLLTGETGVGKDQMARYFHAQARPEGPYIAVNCASVPATLLESELFGHKKGAFTGADQNRIGRFEAANGGVLFLDEIGEMDVALQAKLLGVLERRKILPLGGTREVTLDIKLVAATNCNLEEMVESGQFRRDLYYRLSGITIVIPPLRDRKEDIPLLLNLFLERHGLTAGQGQPAFLDPELVRQFVAYDWPGNIRELLNKVKRLEAMKLMANQGDLSELVRMLFADSQTTASVASGLFERVEEFERKLITEALIASGGNKSQTARMLGVHEATIRTKLKRYGIEPISAPPPTLN